MINNVANNMANNMGDVKYNTENAKFNDAQRETLQKLVLSKRGAFDPNSIALTDGRTNVTYGEFDKLTNCIAVNLKKKDCGPGRCVIVRMGRTIEMVLSMFGIIKSGAAFVPVPLSVPDERLKSIKNSAKPTLVIDMGNYEQLTCALSDKQESSVNVDGVNVDNAFAPEMASPEDPAAIFYTSGSTGEPKGVVQGQKMAGFNFDLYPYRLSEIGIKPKEFDSVLARLNHGFSGAYTYEYGSALLNGKRLVLISEEDEGSIFDTCRLLESGGTFSVPFLPTQLRVFLEDEQFCKALANVTNLCFLAEPVKKDLLDKLNQIESFSGGLITAYGITECHIVTWQDLQHQNMMHPLLSVSVLAVNKNGNKLEKESKGELVINSPSLFDKYLLTDKDKAKKLYEEKFIEIDGLRFMKTGDSGVVHKDGGVEFAGRNEFIVKYHGQRIELPEIEEAIRNVDGIRNCAVVMASTKAGSDILCAYFEAENGQNVDVVELRHFLQKKLPVYMVPGSFKQLDQFPQNANGKVDYKLLSSLPIEADDAAKPLREMTQKEKLIATSAASILKISASEIDFQTNLLALGVDSLNAVHLISDLAKAGYSLTLDDFIVSSNVEELAGKLKKKSKVSAERAKPKKEVSSLVRCTDMQTKWIKNNQQVVETLLAFRGIEEKELQDKMKQLELCHPAFCSAFLEDEGKWYTKVLENRPIRFEYSDLREIGDASGNLTDKQQTFVRIKFDILQGQQNKDDLFYVCAVRVAQDRTILLLRVDHRVVDATSEQILINELLSEEPIKDIDNYVEYLEKTADTATRKQAETFWKEYLLGTTIPHIPKNPNSTKNPKLKKFHITIEGSSETKLRKYCASNGVSISAFVLCQHARAIMDVLGYQDTIVNVAVSGRAMEAEGINDIVGCIVNMVPVRIKKGETEKDFMQSYLRSDRFSFLNADDIFRAAFDEEEVPDMLPFVVSEIFPDTRIKEKYETLGSIPYDKFSQGDFLWQDERGIHLMLHLDIDKWDETIIDKIAAKTRELLNL